MPADVPARGMTVREVARRFRVSTDRVRAWIRTGQLAAINTTDTRCGRPRFVILPEALVAFEKSRQVSPPIKQVKRRSRSMLVDYYPD